MGWGPIGTQTEYSNKQLTVVWVASGEILGHKSTFLSGNVYRREVYTLMHATIPSDLVADAVHVFEQGSSETLFFFSLPSTEAKSLRDFWTKKCLSDLPLALGELWQLLCLASSSIATRHLRYTSGNVAQQWLFCLHVVDGHILWLRVQDSRCLFQISIFLRKDVLSLRDFINYH